MGRGSAGEEEKGSNAGNREGAGRLTPATGETGRGTFCGDRGISLLGVRAHTGTRGKRALFDIGC